MQYFECDYMEGAHPLIMQRLLETNMEKTTGYGFDPYSKIAKEKIRKECNCPEAEIHFLIGGTQTNKIVLKTLLRPYEGVLSADTGHINAHEAGAIENGGHKVLALPNTNGKISAEAVDDYVVSYYKDESYAHMVKPGAVYISHPTECGTLYTRQELENLKAVCEKHHLFLYLDGARLGYGLMSPGTDVTMDVIAHTCDAFYIGGTKVGALFGEALVFTKPHLVENFFSIIKQEGALLAKGRLLSLQFDTLFTDGLYYKISGHAIAMAQKLRKGLKELGCTFFRESPTNQQFIIIDNALLKPLSEQVAYSFWEVYDESHTVIRLATSWATVEEDVDSLLKILKNVLF